jgi:hypothetical protein
MSGKPSSRVSFARLFLEGAAIVVSILLAFSIDAWWDGYQERNEEERLLVALLDEFSENKDLLEEARVHHRAVDMATRELLALAAESTPDISPDSLDQLIGVILWFWAPTKFSMGALNSVVLGGKLHLLQNEELRLKIAGWEAEIEAVHHDERQDYTTFHEDLIPHLRRHTYLPQIANVATRRPGTTEVLPNLEIPQRPGMTDHRSILKDLEFQNLLVQRRWVQWDALDVYDTFEPRIDELIKQIQEELRLAGRETP